MTISSHEQPPAKALFDSVKLIAQCGLRDLGHQRIAVTEQNVMKRAAPDELVLTGLLRADRSHPVGENEC